MNALAILAGVVLLLLSLLGVVRIRNASRRGLRDAAGPPVEQLFPLHSRHFPQVRQALSAADEIYLRARASPELRRRALAERRKVARQFLAGLREDFTRLHRLGRTVASLSPKVSRKQEAERFWLGLRFQVLYGLVWVRLQVGSTCLPQLARLTELVGGLAAQIETAMAALEQASVTRLRTDLSDSS